MTSLAQSIVKAAHALGFSMVGFARLYRLEHREEFFRRWIDDGRAGEMAWLTRDPERRCEPRRLDPRLRSVISLAYPYAAPTPPRVDWRSELRGRIAAYALGPDYHDTVLRQARLVADHLEVNLQPGAVTRLYVDTGPVFEREWASEARLGWFGRNTNLINVHRGSYFFLAEILTDLEFESATQPYRDHCGTCRRCLELCPTQALSDGYLLDSRLCISYLTIEHRGMIPATIRPHLGNWIFGCDICQEVCPWNGDGAEYAPNQELAPFLADLMSLDDAGFRRRYGKTAIARTKRRGLLRNAAIALGNSGNPAAVPILVRALTSDPEAIVRAHAAWGLSRIDEPSARIALLKALRCESDTDVLQEISQALERECAN